MEHDPGRAQELAAIKEELRAHHTVATFRTADESGNQGPALPVLALVEEGQLAATEPQRPP